MSDERSELGVELSAKKIALSAKGDVADKAGKGIGDLLKPFTQYFGSLGDAAEHRRNMRRQIRVFNEAVLYKTLEQTWRLAEDESAKLQPVSMKFLANWSEGASLEETADDDLQTCYSKLLLSESLTPNFNNLIFVDLLRKLSAQHIRFLSEITQGLSDHQLFEPSHILSENFICYRLLEDIGYDGSEQLPLDAEDRFLRRKEYPGSFVSGLTVDNIEDAKGRCEGAFPTLYANHPSMRNPDYAVTSPLLALGLIEAVSHTQEEEQGLFKVSFSGYFLTSFGFDFVRACVSDRNVGDNHDF